MTTLRTKPGSTTDSPCPAVSSHCQSHSANCSPFLNWTGDQTESEDGWAVVFRSLVATVKLQPALDVYLEAKSVKFLDSMKPMILQDADAFLRGLGRAGDESSTNFVQSVVVLLSTPSQVITTSAMKMINSLLLWCSPKLQFTLVQADLIPQIIVTLNPLSLSIAEAVGIHTKVMKSIDSSFSLATPRGLAQLGIEDHYKQQAVHEAVLQQVLAPSKKYIWNLCVNRFSIVDGEQSHFFLIILARLLQICPYHQPTMDIVLHMPVFLPIPSCLTSFEKEETFYYCQRVLNESERKWSKQGGYVRQMGNMVRRMLRMEGIEDVVEEKLRNDRKEYVGRVIVSKSMTWNNLLGMNLQKQE
ncbi:hypothetical protein BLNAU_17201 [Blattamonas nauphoetae]|uniref:Uncharacterized protein n=1 Tax=Blattamonas nauphoetae TaxID=2049346 RepID=A0ABQ9XC67_9EUKA|nr:hypothetical protein BLNAU_17201 [Blattamonas nauphoetae]